MYTWLIKEIPLESNSEFPMKNLSSSVVVSMDFLCTFLQYSSLRGPRNSTTISAATQKEPQGAWRMGLVVSGWLLCKVPGRRGGEMETQLSGDSREGVQGSLAVESGRLQQAGCWFASVGRHTTYMQLKESQNKSKDTVISHSIPDNDQRSRKRASGTD